MSVSESDDGSRPFLVVTGSSAGGIEALSRLASGLPGDLPAAVVIGQHLDPEHVSHLDNILRQRSPLPVTIVAKTEKLNPGTAYVIPPKHDVRIADGVANVFERARGGPKPSIDDLFGSAAEVYEDRLIAIILSGMGSDGLAGARVVKEHGGTVIVQDPATASHPAMPLAIPPTLVDLFVAPEKMGTVLAEIMRGAEPPEDTSEQSTLRMLLMQLRDRSGIDFQQYKTPTLMRRLSRLMVATGTESLGEYVRYLQTHPEGYQRLVSAFLIKVTDFFRDDELFGELREHILPRLIADAAAGTGELRIWSAGASTGEEAYSLAMLCADVLRDDFDHLSVRVFATDIDEDAVAFARRGRYTKEALKHVPPQWMARYFVPGGDAYEIAKRIRNMTVFGQHDLGQRAPFPRIDLCTCRNVLIYFTRELQQRTLQLFAFSLREGGYLVLGKAETTNPLPEYFEVVDGALKIYRRVGERVLIPPKGMRDVGPTLSDIRSAAKNTPPLIPAIMQRAEQRPSSNELIGAAMAHSPTGMVLVDRRYDILAINSAARSLLDIHGVGLGEDVVHLTKSIDNRDLRALIDAAFRNEEVKVADFRAKDGDGKERWLQIACHRETQLVPSRADTVSVVISDVTQVVESRHQLEERCGQQSRELETARARAQELSERQKSLLSANDELTSANNELRTTNEQLLIGAEEVASANEEIETLNEEMQATNEELETLNEELQATVEELNTTNDELASRSTELERAVAERQTMIYQVNAERDAMVQALEGFAGPVAIVDEQGRNVYVSRELDGRLKKDGDWWRRGGVVNVDGASRLQATPRRLETEPPLILVSFRPVE